MLTISIVHWLPMKKERAMSPRRSGSVFKLQHMHCCNKVCTIVQSIASTRLVSSDSVRRPICPIWWCFAHFIIVRLSNSLTLLSSNCPICSLYYHPIVQFASFACCIIRTTNEKERTRSCITRSQQSSKYLWTESQK